jgi:hypothetical protein
VNRVLRRIFGPQKGKSNGRLKKFFEEELNNFSSSPSIIWFIKSRRIGLEEHAAHVEMLIN